MKMITTSICIAGFLVSASCSHFALQEENTAQALVETDKTTIAETKYTSFTPNTLYSLLVAELALDRGRADVAVSNYLNQAKETLDPAVAKRATQIALGFGAEKIATQSAVLWVDADPSSVDAHQRASIQFAKFDEFKKALHHMEQVLKLNGETSFDYLAVYANDLDQENRDQLILGFNQLIEKYPDNLQIYIGKSILLRQSKRYDEALELIGQLSRANQKNTQVAFLRSQILRDKGESEKALKVLKAALKDDPENNKLTLFYARMLYDTGHLDEAYSAFLSLQKKIPDNPEFILSLALISIDAKKNQQAEFHLQQLLDSNQFVDEAYYYLGIVAEGQSNPEKALTNYQKVRRGPNLIAAIARAARVMVEENNIDQARKHLSNARENHKEKEINLYLIETDLLLEKKLFDDAHALLDIAITKHTDNAELLYARAMISEKRDDLNALEKDLRLILSFEPENAIALNALGYTLTDRTSRHDEALDLITRAFALDPENPAIIDSLGWVNYRLGKHQEALKFLREAYSLYPDQEIAAHLGEVLWIIGEKSEAEQLLQNSLEKNPESKILIETINRLKTNH